MYRLELEEQLRKTNKEYLTLKDGSLLEVNSLGGQKRESERERDSILISKRKCWLLERVCIRKPIQIFI